MSNEPPPPLHRPPAPRSHQPAHPLNHPLSVHRVCMRRISARRPYVAHCELFQRRFVLAISQRPGIPWSVLFPDSSTSWRPRRSHRTAVRSGPDSRVESIVVDWSVYTVNRRCSSIRRNRRSNYAFTLGKLCERRAARWRCRGPPSVVEGGSTRGHLFFCCPYDCYFSGGGGV